MDLTENELTDDELARLQNVWELVDELGVLSQRLQEAADAAMAAIERKSAGVSSGSQGGR